MQALRILTQTLSRTQLTDKMMGLPGIRKTHLKPYVTLPPLKAAGESKIPKNPPSA